MSNGSSHYRLALIGDPGQKKHSAFEKEAVAMRRNAQPIKQTLERIARQQNDA
jgi:hypothetical protein